MYNSALYNEPNYNSTHFTLDAFESMSSADQRLMATEAIKTELAILADALSKNLDNNPFLDDVFTTDDDVANAVTKVLQDTATLSDNQIASIAKSLAELITMSELRSMVYELRRVDSVTLVDNLTKSITEKVLTEAIRLQSWISVKKTGSQWSD